MVYRDRTSLLLIVIVSLGFGMLLTGGVSLAVAPVDSVMTLASGVGAKHSALDRQRKTIRGRTSTTLPQVSAGLGSTCVINRVGTLYCWGSYSNPPSDLGPVRQVITGYNYFDWPWLPPERRITQYTCAITVDGTLRCWGDNGYGEATAPPDLGAVSQVSAGASHTCAVTVDEVLRCWGNNDSGQTGVPEAMGTVSQVSAGGGVLFNGRYIFGTIGHTCALTVDGALRCWGDTLWGYGQTNVPGDLGAVSQVSAGRAHTCAVTTDGALRCWGHNDAGQTDAPADLGAVSQVSAGAYHTCALTVDGALRCWGHNDAGQTTIPRDPLWAFEPEVWIYLPFVHR